MRIDQVPGIIEREEENCYLLINRKNGEKLVLNENTYFVWNLCKDSAVRDVVGKVIDAFELDQREAEVQVNKVIESLYQKGFIKKKEE